MLNYNTEKEVWKDVVGYEGLYEISSHGRLNRINEHSLERVSVFYCNKRR